MVAGSTHLDYHFQKGFAERSGNAVQYVQVGWEQKPWMTSFLNLFYAIDLASAKIQQ